ncbi:sterol desaturase family protein [Bradyrhizobium sp. sBnM-33]|uniref:sterol desaturase family protein n=1 Tax=Bradyrhizobium sp. sBnM-33 TaxID=2831780 RepID=UPI0024BF0D2A|nr:sterol desaturase family protein [Bradyrhizobium sp. sBnM-33]WOH54783.1 sterol desaturase family protein [Bradyrhizobium sp. sBnM-33]
MFFLPLAWIGFNPFAVIAMLGINLMYQFFIHTELAPRLGPLELVLNTPAHHRVHHASNEPCLDKNFGGMLIIFDRLFGTFAEAPAQERSAASRLSIRCGSRSASGARCSTMSGRRQPCEQSLGRCSDRRDETLLTFRQKIRSPSRRR